MDEKHLKADKLFENVNRTIIMRDLSDGLAFSNFARLVWKENILSALSFGKKLKKEKDSFPDVHRLYEAFELSTVDQLENAIFAFSPFVDEKFSVAFSNFSSLV